MSSNPDFVAQSDTNFTPIRYYTQFDPYWYAVDNRPLQDIETNLKNIRSGGADAARRASIINSLNLAAVLQDLYTAPAQISGATRVATGLKVTNPSTNLIRITPGATYELRGISATVNDSVMKQAFLTKNTDFTLTPPVAVGTSVVYTVEAQFVEITSTSIPTSTLPILDSNNTYLPSTLIHGELKLNLVVGSATATGSEQPASTTVGNFPLYNITLTQGSTVPVVKAHTNSPYFKGCYRASTPVAIPSNNATLQVIGDLPAVTFSTTGNSAVILPVMGSIKDLNPYAPLKLKLTFSSSAAGGSLSLRTRYKGFLPGEAHTASTVNSAIEVVPYVGAINTIQTADTVTAVIPNTEFAGFVGGVWSINKERLSLALERVGDDAGDTNAGTLNLFNVVLFQ